MKTCLLMFLLISSFVPKQTCVENYRSNSKLGYNLQLYNSINSYRTKHTIKMLGWNQTLVETADRLAAQVGKEFNSVDIGKSDGGNFFVTTGTVQPSVFLVTGSWYNESFYYDFRNPNHNPLTLNFTAMIWKSSTSVGIGSYTNNNHTSVVAIFYPTGNIRGEFKENVIPIYKN